MQQDYRLCNKILFMEIYVKNYFLDNQYIE